MDSTKVSRSLVPSPRPQCPPMGSRLSRLTQHIIHLKQAILRATTHPTRQGLASIHARKVINPISRLKDHRKTLKDKKAMSRLTLITRTLLGSSIGAVEANIEITTEVALRTIAGTSTIKEEEVVATKGVATKATEVETTIIVAGEETHRVVAGTSNGVAPTSVANLTIPIGNRLVVRAITKAPGLLLTSLNTRTPFMMNSTWGDLALRTARETLPLESRRAPLQSPRLSAKKSS